MINNLYYGSDNADIDCFRNASFTFDTDVLATFLRRIYNGFDTSNDVEPTMWREILRIINEATVDGLVQGNYDTNIDKTFLEKLAHSNEVFSAFKVHDMGVDMAKKMRTDEGKLKPFSEWKKDIKSIASHYCGAWLQTEYNTATLRAKFAAEWKQYEADADIMPNLRWMPTTSANPEEEHKVYWMNRLTLPVGDKFWDKHHPGDHWNCKCSLEQTDEPANPDVLSHIPDVKAQKGLAANPGKTGEMFDDSHPYYAHDCSNCWANNNKGLKNVFTNSKRKVNCNLCREMSTKIKKASDAKEMFGLLPSLSGAEYINQLRRLTELKIYKQLDKNIFSAIGKDSEDFDNLLAGAKKAVRHKNKVFILPNPKGVRSADYIFLRKGVYKMYDLKTIEGAGSIGTRLEESIGQTRRVYINLATTYPANRMASEIKKYFEMNDEALEVLVAVGNKMVSVERYMISERNFFAEFRKRVEQ